MLYFNYCTNVASATELKVFKQKKNLGKEESMFYWNLKNDIELTKK